MGSFRTYLCAWLLGLSESVACSIEKKGMWNKFPSCHWKERCRRSICWWWCHQCCTCDAEGALRDAFRLWKSQGKGGSTHCCDHFQPSCDISFHIVKLNPKLGMLDVGYYLRYISVWIVINSNISSINATSLPIRSIQPEALTVTLGIDSIMIILSHIKLIVKYY